MASTEEKASSGAPTEPGGPGGPAETAPGERITKVEPSRGQKWLRSFTKHMTELPMLILSAFVIAVLIKTFLVQAFYIPSGSMIPTLRRGDRVIVEKLSYFLGEPGRGDVVVFEKDVFGEALDLPWYDDARNFFRELLGLPTGEVEDYIKRVVAVGGDTIRYSGNPRKLFVNGEEVDISYVKGGRDRFSQALTADDCEGLDMPVVDDACRVPAGRVFVMGDNRANSEDSRLLGPIDERRIVGRAFAVIWPFGRWRGL
jgi:signal peptidase I